MTKRDENLKLVEKLLREELELAPRTDGRQSEHVGRLMAVVCEIIERDASRSLAAATLLKMANVLCQGVTAGEMADACRAMGVAADVIPVGRGGQSGAPS